MIRLYWYVLDSAGKLGVRSSCFVFAEVHVIFSFECNVLPLWFSVCMMCVHVVVATQII